MSSTSISGTTSTSSGTTSTSSGITSTSSSTTSTNSAGSVVISGGNLTDFGGTDLGGSLTSFDISASSFQFLGLPSVNLNSTSVTALILAQMLNNLNNIISHITSVSSSQQSNIGLVFYQQVNIQALNEQLASYNQEATRLQTLVDTLVDTNLPAAQQEVSSAQTTYNMLLQQSPPASQADIQTAFDRLAQAESDLQNVNTQITDNRANLTVVQGQIATINTQLSTVVVAVTNVLQKIFSDDSISKTQLEYLQKLSNSMHDQDTDANKIARDNKVNRSNLEEQNDRVSQEQQKRQSNVKKAAEEQASKLGAEEKAKEEVSKKDIHQDSTTKNMSELYAMFYEALGTYYTAVQGNQQLNSDNEGSTVNNGRTRINS